MGLTLPRKLQRQSSYRVEKECRLASLLNLPRNFQRNMVMAETTVSQPVRADLECISNRKNRVYNERELPVSTYSFPR